MTVETIIPQQLRALGRANFVRLERAGRRRDLGDLQAGAAAGQLANWIEDPPPELETAAAMDVLMWQRRWGRARARRLLFGLGIRENKPIGEFTPRQRAALAAVLRTLQEPRP